MNETEIPTPRTDAFIVEHQGWGPTDWNWRCFARQLERENAAMREVIRFADQLLAMKKTILPAPNSNPTSHEQLPRTTTRR